LHNFSLLTARTPGWPQTCLRWWWWHHQSLWSRRASERHCSHSASDAERHFTRLSHRSVRAIPGSTRSRHDGGAIPGSTRSRHDGEDPRKAEETSEPAQEPRSVSQSCTRSLRSVRVYSCSHSFR